MSRRRAFPAALLATVVALLCSAAGAAAAPVLSLESNSNTTAAPGSQFRYFLTLENTGDTATSGQITVRATLPPGIDGISAGGFNWACSGFPGQVITCTHNVALDAFGGPEYLSVGFGITAEVAPDASGAKTAQFGVWGDGTVTLPDGSPCGTAPPATPCATVVDRTEVTEAAPEFGVEAFDSQALQADGSTSSVAGGHPDSIATTISFNTLTNPVPNTGQTWPVEPGKDFVVDLPPGFIGYPTATGGSLCTLAQASNADDTVARPLCPPNSQVGLVRAVTAEGTLISKAIPVFNMVPPVDAPARFAFNVAGSVIVLDASVRSGADSGVSVMVRNVPELALASTTVTFWGVPSDPSHDARRACPGEYDPGSNGATCTSDAPAAAFLRNPTSCTGPVTTSLAIDSWINPGALTPDGRPELSDPNWVSAGILFHESPGYPFAPDEWGAPLGMSGCDAVPFDPTISVRPTTNAADSPTGLDVSLKLPQSTDPDTIAEADLKKAVVTLPEGMAVNPSSAGGLGGCSLAEIDLHGENTEPSCPDSSKIGSVEIATPLLSEPLEGDVYLAKPADNPFGSLLALYIVARGPGTVVKLPGEVRANAQSGRLETVFDDNPQLPFSQLDLHLKSGPRAPLITPKTCGSFATQARLSSWARPGEAVPLSDSFTISSGPNGAPCPAGAAQRPLAPRFSAGVVDPTAGAQSPFVMQLTRADGEQELSGLSVDTPPGLSAYLRGVPYCPQAALDAAGARSGADELASPGCPAASRIGSVEVGAGAGPNPFQVSGGKVYLAGPYKGAPLSLAVLTPALAGPFDLGTVLVRAAAYVDPGDASLHVVSDPLPTILRGIPLDLRQISLTIDRPSFILAPTSCDPMSVGAAVTGLGGATANPSVRFQVGNCARLAFKPHLSLRLRGATKRSGHPALRAVLKMPASHQANIARASVVLPHSEFLDQSHIRTVCTRVQFAAGAGNGAECPQGSIYGHARAISPLLDEPLQGPVFLRSSSHKLPDLVAALHGQIDIELQGRIDSVRGGIRSTFETVPDAPVSKFVLTMKGGKKGLIQNSADLCAERNRATVKMDGQNGKIRDFAPIVRAECRGQGPGSRGGRR